MKYLMVFATVFMVACTGCLKNDKGCTNVSPQSEEGQITAYATAQGITALKHNSGIYYQIITPGTGNMPRSSSTVKAIYTGKFLDGRVFDQATTPIEFPLNRVIDGWQIGIPLIAQGGRIKLIIPSALAYGCNGYQSIPGNTVLYFDVELVEVY